MVFSFATPSHHLAPFVRQYWALEAARPPDQDHLQPLIPTGLAEIDFYLERPPVEMTNRAELHDHALISGQQTARYDIAMRGSVSLFSITLTPLGGVRLFNLPMNELVGMTVPLDAVRRIGANGIREELANAATFDARVRIAERFLLARLHATTPPAGVDRLARAVDIITRTGGRAGIPELAAQACLSVKQFERLFSGTIGVRPKLFLRIVRFQRAIHGHSIGAGADLTDLAYAAGYADQSHMIGEFRAFSGLTPRRFFDACPSSSDYFRALPASRPSVVARD